MNTDWQSRIETLEAPMSDEQIEELISFWEEVFGNSNKPFRRVLRGDERESNRNVVFAIRIDGKFVGTAHLTTPVIAPHLGGLGEVCTSPELRRLGIAEAVCRRARDVFMQDGGEVLFLATSNPSAACLYGKLGWNAIPGSQVMACCVDTSAPEVSLRDYFEEVISVTVSEKDASLRVRMIPLLVAPHPWRVLDMNAKMYSVRYARQGSCMGLFPRYRAACQEGKGTWFAAETSDGRVVGLSSVCVDGSDCLVDGFAHPRFSDAHGDLMKSAIRWGQEHGARRALATLAVEDESKIRAFEDIGFEKLDVGKPIDMQGERVQTVIMELKAIPTRPALTGDI